MPRKKYLIEVMLLAGYSKQVIAESLVETFKVTGELPEDSFACGLHTRKGGGWFLMWDWPGRRGIAPCVKEITL